jgi:hypothetical protein
VTALAQGLTGAERPGLPVEQSPHALDQNRAESLLRSASLLLARGETGDAVRALHDELRREIGQSLKVEAASYGRRQAEEQHRLLAEELSRQRRRVPVGSGWRALRAIFPQWAAWAIVALVAGGLMLRYGYAIFGCWRWANQHPDGAWISRYYGEHDFQDFQVLRYDVAIDYDWGKGAPAGTLDRDHFSASWDTCMVVTDEVTLRLQLYADDAGKVFIDNAEKIRVRRPGSKAAIVSLEPGTHHLRVEYDERRRAAKIVLSGLEFAGTASYRFQRPQLIDDKARCAAPVP